MKKSIVAYLTRRPSEAAFLHVKEKKMFLTGWKTLIFNGMVVVITALLQWMAGIDWVQYVGPEWAVTVVAVVNIMLRFVTSTPWGRSS